MRTKMFISVIAAMLLIPFAVEARVTRIVIDTVTSPAFGGQEFPAGSGRQYEQLVGRAFGELDPNDPLNAIIQDIQLAPINANGKVEYMATFQITKPIDMSKSSHLMWQAVPNRGGRISLPVFDRNNGDVGLSAGWQGDNIGGTDQTNPAREFAVVPVAKNPDGSTITGPVLGRIFNKSGPNSQPIIVYSNPMPYEPATLETTQATLETHEAETQDGAITGVTQIPGTDWAWASCSTDNPFPGTPNPRQICLKYGFDPALLYQIRFIAKDPYVLGIGFAAFRDLGSFFKYETQDDFGTPSPLAGDISWIISTGVSQSGNFLRQFIHLGFNQDEAGRQVQDGANPRVGGRKLVMNVRFATPDQILLLYNAGSEGPVWYHKFPDTIRGLPPAGILDRCTRTNTCPKVVEYQGSTEFWGLHLSPDFVGVAADKDIPIPPNVRSYYIPSSPHNGGAGGFNVNGGNVPNGPGAQGWGACTFRGNQMPFTQATNALNMRFRDWVRYGKKMPPSRHPILRSGSMNERNLVEPTKEAMGFPNIPAILASSNPNAPDGIINNVKDYDFGDRFNYTDTSGIVDIQPPIIKRVFPSLVPRVDADGNEVGGVPVVQALAPLGTYLGWNITAGGFFEGQICSYAHGYIPFARTLAERLATGDPRLSLEERYGNHAGFVAAVTAAGDQVMAEGFLLPADRDLLIAQAEASDVLKP